MSLNAFSIMFSELSSILSVTFSQVWLVTDFIDVTSAKWQDPAIRSQLLEEVTFIHSNQPNLRRTKMVHKTL
jgi:hypothetical protein